MAYPTRQREPLLDSDMAAAIERRSKELIGLALLVAAVLALMMIWSYSPDDPNWMVSTDAPVNNWLGRTGASLSGPLFTILGWGIVALPIILLAWGARFVFHKGEDRAIGRLIFGPIWVAVCAIYASTLTPSAAWESVHSFGLGGLFGDTALAFVLTILPFGSVLAIKLMSLLAAILVLVFGAFVLGFSRIELRAIQRWFLLGLVMSYAGLMTLLGRGASAGVSAARGYNDRRVARREDARIADQDDAAWDVQQPEFDEEEPEPKSGLLARMPSLIRRAEPLPEPELYTPEALEFDDAPHDDGRVQERIADAIRARVRATPLVEASNSAPLTKGRGHGPQPLIADAVQGMRQEPPLTGQPSAPMAAPMEEVFDDEAVPLKDPAPAHVPAAPIIPAAPAQRRVVQQPVRKPAQPSTRAKAEAQPTFFDKANDAFELPPLSLLESPEVVERHHLSDEALEENARMLESVLDDYGVKGDIVSVRPGPVVTMYELEPAPGLKASRVIGLADDIARSMAALSARVSTVPGRSVIGIELPNENREKVVLREILASRGYGDGNQKLPLALGKDIGGDSVVANLAKMPHLLIAGTTGSGKSVAINTMILSLLYKLPPEECRLIMIDPKMLELSVYDGIPHLLSPVVTDPKKAVVALKWVVGEMEERYRKMSKMGVRNIDGYNGRVRDALAAGEMFSRTVQTGFDDETGDPVFETEEFEPKKLPYIVVIVDEMADLMMVAGKEIEACIQRLAQMARASGIHLIMATQRPSVDVITGTIKANFPTRISFQVTSKIDSRTILGEMGAEQLLGMGDMLYMAGGAKITRCHAPFVSDEEVEEIVNHLKAFGPPEYVGGVVEGPADEKADNIDAVLGLGGNTDGEDALYDQAVAIVIRDRKCSTSYIQRKLAIGYNKAARLVEQMEDEGVVSSANHVGKREILVPEQ